jgi:hypothetical protein
MATGGTKTRLQLADIALCTKKPVTALLTGLHAGRNSGWHAVAISRQTGVAPFGLDILKIRHILRPDKTCRPFPRLSTSF